MSMPRLTDVLAEIVGADHVLQAQADVEPYLIDWRRRYHGAALCVVCPANTQEVAAVMAACAKAGAKVVAQGGNTGLVGGGIPWGDEILLSLRRLDKIRALDPINNTLTVEAGCVLQRVQEAASAVDRLFPLSLASQGSATIGGNISSNAGGVQVLRYGNMRELVLGLEVVLPDGRVWNGLRALRKDNTGYDLKHLFIGAEGTLGVVTAAVLKLFPQPRAQLTAWLALPSAEAALTLLTTLRAACGDRLTAFELIGQAPLQLLKKHLPQVRLPLPDIAEWQVLLDLGDTWADMPLAQMLMDAIEPLLAQSLVTDALIASSVAQADALWRVRESIPEAQKIEGFSIKHDIAMPTSMIAQFIAEADQSLNAQFDNLRIVCFGHVGDGNLHYNISPAVGDDVAFLQQSDAVNRVVHDLVHQYNGSISAEHGIGQLKTDELLRYKSTVELSLMQAVKHALDPENTCNPGKILAAPDGSSDDQ